MAARSIVASAPTRLDFGGGWTDVPPYPEERGGFVCNLAIERRATVRLRQKTSSDHNERAQTLALVEAACAAAGVGDVNVTLTSDFPVGAGLGGSSAAGVALAGALAAWNGRTPLPEQLAESSREVETAGLKIPGGSQDHYAAAFGGALGLHFGSTVTVDRIPVNNALTSELESRLLLFYTGESRISGETITAVLDAYENRVPRVVGALERMKALALEMCEAIRSHDVDRLGALIDEHWAHQRSLHPRITTERIDEIGRVATENGAIGMKALGASGGGCVLVVAPRDATARISTAVAPLAERLEWRVAHSGVDVRVEMPL